MEPDQVWIVGSEDEGNCRYVAAPGQDPKV
jgi:hypothetical protein